MRILKSAGLIFFRLGKSFEWSPFMHPSGFKNNLKTRVKKHGQAFRRFISNTFRSFTPEDLRRTLNGLGIVQSDTVLVHGSFDAFEGFQGKPSHVISVLQDVVGDAGLLMMPTMPFSGTAVAYARTNPIFDVLRTPSRMGLLSELFRRSQAVVRSVHPTHSVALWGADAHTVAAGHHLARTPCGVGTPFTALLRRRGKIVLLGTDIGVLTFYHALEELMEQDLPQTPFTQEVFHLSSKTSEGLIIATDCQLFDPAMSRRRNLHKMTPFLKKSGAWREARVGGLKVIILAAADVEAVVRHMNQQGIHCYD